jgi:hypothetical protein
MIRTIKQGDLRMTLPTNDDFSNRELSVEQLETIAAGVFLMSGAPNSINGTLRVQNLPPSSPRIWMGGSEHSPGLRLF